MRSQTQEEGGWSTGRGRQGIESDRLEKQRKHMQRHTQRIERGVAARTRVCGLGAGATLFTRKLGSGGMRCLGKNRRQG